MSYSLDLYFEPAIERREILRYFAARRHFKDAKDDAFFYENPHTGVYFWLRLRCARNILLQRKVVSAEFELNYNRPSYFATEAEIELSAFVAAFKPRIFDDQMRGMGEGPYSREGFLSGWNFGNLFTIRTIMLRYPDDNIPSMPTDALRMMWQWNYQFAERKERSGARCWVPKIMFRRINGRPSRVVVWPLGMPTFLPRVDHVLIGRFFAGEQRFGLASWSEVLEVVQRAGFNTTKDPLELEYIVTPSQIAEWVANIDLIDLDALERLADDKVLDEEAIAAAQAIEGDEGEESGSTEMNRSV